MSSPVYHNVPVVVCVSSLWAALVIITSPFTPCCLPTGPRCQFCLARPLLHPYNPTPFSPFYNPMCHIDLVREKGALRHVTSHNPARQGSGDRRSSTALCQYRLTMPTSWREKAVRLHKSLCPDTLANGAYMKRPALDTSPYSYCAGLSAIIYMSLKTS